MCLLVAEEGGGSR